jgi:mRNA-degrading endonuclease toxin of MazEF toxin-antitoxin module
VFESKGTVYSEEWLSDSEGKQCLIKITKTPYFDDQVQFLPITSSVNKLYPNEAYVAFRGKKAKAMADQLTTVSKKRLINSAGSISSTEMEGIGKAITIQLGL